MYLDPKELPGIADLRRRAKALAMLDAIICPEWEYRYYSYNSRWSHGEEMASMRNSQGDEWFILFDSVGTAIKGLDHESVIARGVAFPAAIRSSVPPAFSSLLNEPAFSMDRASFCYWRKVGDQSWSRVAHPNTALAAADDGSEAFLKLFVTPPVFYQEFASAYYEREFALKAIVDIYAHTLLTAELVGSLNPQLTLNEVRKDAAEIDYPCG